MGDTHKFSDGRLGAALPVRITPRASRNEIVEVLSDQTVKIRLVSPPDEKETNMELVKFLGTVLDIPETNMEIVAGMGGRDKLVSIIDMPVSEVHRRILLHLS